MLDWTYAQKVSAWRGRRMHDVDVLAKDITDHFGPWTLMNGLDIGCNDGAMMVAIQQKVPHLAMFGLDANPYAVSHAQLLDRKVNKIGSRERFPYHTGEMDLVICIATLAHMPDPQFAIDEMARVTRPGGLVIIETPHPMFDAVMKPHLLLTGYRGDRTIIRKVSPKRLQSMVEKPFEIDSFEQTGRELPRWLQWLNLRSDYKMKLIRK